uniref:Uncharacterized protein n=1 Tax=Anopheles coluzzii TaxID=1518534 RepID=A0A6E8W670_ANOCL
MAYQTKAAGNILLYQSDTFCCRTMERPATKAGGLLVWQQNYQKFKWLFHDDDPHYFKAHECC